MKLIHPNFEILEQESGLEGVYKAIERAGRVCYKSEDKITEDSAKKFVDMLIARGHTAMLEHGTVYLDVMSEDIVSRKKRYCNNPYSRMYHNTLEETWAYPHLYVTTNYRVLLENGWLDDLKYICKPTEYHEKRVAVKFITDRGVSHELVRHRVFSFAQESTRYCNYSKDKFGGELTFIIPSWLNIPEGLVYWHDGINYRVGANADNNYIGSSVNPSQFENVKEIDNFIGALEGTSRIYLSLLREYKWTPQQARQVLPNALKTEVVVTGFIEDWQHFFKLRCDNAAHPDIRALAIPLKEEFIKREYING